MRNKILAAVRRYEMVKPGQRVICAVSGGADSMALLWCMWLEREKLGITVEAAHFNHHLRGEESRRDEAFVRDFCDFHDIPLHVGGEQVRPGKKGLEAAARQARYRYLRTLGGTIATAHTADDNAETVLLHLLRGTGLRGLGGITPKADGLIRPMLDVTRAEVEAFLAEQWIDHIDDSSNESDDFLRNRLRHQVMPLLRQENPSMAENISSMAQRLREDEAALAKQSGIPFPPSVSALRDMEPPLRRRALERFLRESGVAEPEARHIEQAELLVLCDNPSASARFPGGIIIRRVYDTLTAGGEPISLPERPIMPGQRLELPEAGLALTVLPGGEAGPSVCLGTHPVVRCRRAGDEITLSGGTKSLKKLLIDRKIPQYQRLSIPVVADENGVAAVYGIGVTCRERPGQRFTLIWETLSEQAEG